MQVKKKTKNKNQKLPKVKIGIFGGSGFYDLLDKKKEYEIKTPYGKPSDRIMVGELEGKQVAFLPRHGRKHKLPPHKIPYQANLWAFKKLRIEYVISPCAVGSLKAKIKPGDFVILDHFVDRTKLREDTFYHGPKVAHFAFDKPYCDDLRKLAIGVCKELKIRTHKKGTVVVIEGPRFSTKPESRWYSNQGWDVVNMTHYPEVVLARELEMCFVGIALVTDWDVGLEGNPKIKAVTFKDVLRVFKENNEKAKELVTEMVGRLGVEKKRTCHCATASDGVFL